MGTSLQMHQNTRNLLSTGEKKKMNEVDDIDDWFKLFDDIMNMGYSGGYMRRLPPNRTYAKEDYSNYFQEDKDNIYFTIELRGIREEDISITPKEDSLTIEVMYEGRILERTYPLSHRINPKKSVISFNNCVLDVTLRKVKSRKKKEIING